jgi:glycosyltransferase involved in cell wall biosynthesis
MESQRQPVIAIAHDYLTQRGGAERVVLALSEIFPEATIYTSLFDPQQTFSQFADKTIVTSWLNRVSAVRRRHRLGLPLFPLAISSLVIDADVVIASSSGWAHGITTRGKVVVYCHSPARFLYLSNEYVGSQRRGWLLHLPLKVLAPFLIRWDRRAALRANAYLANSTVVQTRIRKLYGIEAERVFPPLNIDVEAPKSQLSLPENFGVTPSYFLLVSRLLPYKNVDQVIDAFRLNPQLRLLIVGHGPLRDQLVAQLPSNVHLVSDISDDQLRWAYSNAQALLAPSHEDFGLTVIEAAAWGVPSVALRAGGYLDTVIEGVTGTFFEQPSAKEISQALSVHSTTQFDKKAIRSHAESFNLTRFGAQLRASIERVLADQE